MLKCKRSIFSIFSINENHLFNQMVANILNIVIIYMMCKMWSYNVTWKGPLLWFLVLMLVGKLYRHTVHSDVRTGLCDSPDCVKSNQPTQNWCYYSSGVGWGQKCKNHAASWIGNDQVVKSKWMLHVFQQLLINSSQDLWRNSPSFLLQFYPSTSPHCLPNPFPPLMLCLLRLG